ncbi:hypothetical protein WR25_10721 [Diploscapter pachys]|uniref:RNA helicase n=1 Tax=Diploscapter pachys TaxID=2018661 RepID=A0A2A2KYJ9_9BILA|nr:hypothetical protein WR25_10721 [Diploscapter pachys]
MRDRFFPVTSLFYLLVFYGGLDVKTQEAALRSSPDVVVATPGRLIDHLHNSPNFTLSTIEVLVLDEADRMLEEAFADQMKELIRLCAKNRQTLLFSATMTDEIDELATMSLKKPVKIFINENTETALKLRQEFVRIRSGRERDRESIVSALVTRTFQQNTMIFVKTKVECQRMQILLGLLGIKVGQMHSNLSQAQRVGALTKFKKGEIDVLVSTDLASRGLDIEGVQTVINMHMPKTIKQYIHRVGRTARAGKAGRSISLVGEDERKLLKEIIQANPNKAMKQRVLAGGTVEAYRKRVDDLEESIKEIIEAERVERELRIAEATTEKAKQKLENPNEPERVWFQKKSQSDKEKARLEKKKLREEEKKRKEAMKTPEEKRLEEEAAFQQREAKRRRKGKHTRLRAVVEDGERRIGRNKMNAKSRGARVKPTTSLSEIPSIKPSGHIQKKNQNAPRGKGNKKSFTKELASVNRRSVKAARHGPEDNQFQKARVAHRMKTKKR